jgi:aldehyde dehydrogenase (NAD(P)+)
MSAESTRALAHVEHDAALELLHANAGRWAGLPLAERRALLDAMRRAVVDVAAEWAQIASEAKGLKPGSPLTGEEWIVGPYAVLMYIGALGQTLDALLARRDPLAGFRFDAAPGGRTRLRVFPHSLFERLLLNGYRADVWFTPGVEQATVRRDVAHALRDPDGGGVTLVLGAGNVSSIAPLDALYKLYAANRVVLLKLNPVTDYLRDVFERVLAPFVEAGFLRIAQGGADTGRHLVAHPLVDDLHMTGSARTHDAIVFGDTATSNGGAPRTRVVDKPITSELGGISPAIVVPGKWAEADLRYQAEHIATQRLHNSGCNCIATQVVVLAREWKQKERFLAHLRRALRDAPGRPAYYPGSQERIEGALSCYGDDALRLSDTRVLIPGLAADAERQQAFDEEYFAPVVAVTELDGGDAEPEAFLRAAVAFANERLAGTLGAGLIAHPRTLRQLGPALERAVAELRYGTVAINCWLGVGYLTPRASWGAYPGHTIEDVQSGIGVVHNALLLEHCEKTVISGPFRPLPRSLMHGEPAISPRPPWFVTNRTAATTARRLTYFAGAPAWRRLPAIFSSALRG